ncbi:hypothetical protein EYV94_11495 [Puteibacter caeruleilacunae]|nr:hypothetical protein EYV94_11495 [Puteibacter caeruleilacunae]
MKKKLVSIVVVLVIILNVFLSVTPKVTKSSNVTLKLVEARADGSSETEEDDTGGSHDENVPTSCVDTGNFFTDIIDFIFGTEE